MSSGPPTMLLPPSKGKWIQQETQITQKSMMMDIAMLLNMEQAQVCLKLSALTTR